VRAPSLCEDIDRGENEVDQPLNDSLRSQGSISWSPLSISLVSRRILHKGPQRQGGFNWSSQHLVTEVMRDESRSRGFCQSVVGRCYDPATRQLLTGRTSVPTGETIV
jgi:hypothetical protein